MIDLRPEQEETLTLNCEILRETEHALLVVDGEGEMHWLSKAHILAQHDEHTAHTGEIMLVIPLWLAEQRGIDR